jgi:hypothetical protein
MVGRALHVLLSALALYPYPRFTHGPGKVTIRTVRTALLGIRPVHGRLTQRRWGSITLYSLMLLQVHLLWVSVLHHHEMVFSPSAGNVVRTAPVQQPPLADSAVFCTACQVVRQNAVRPAVAAAAPRPNLFLPLHPANRTSGLESYQPAVSYARAPPLA